MTRKRVWRWALAILMPMFIVALAIFFFSTGSIVTRAAQTTVTVITDGNGTVSVGGSTSQSEASSQIEHIANDGETVTLTANAAEGYVFAYWYTVENTPLSYEAEFSYTVPVGGSTVHAKFFKNEDKITVTASDDWNQGVEGTYGVKSGLSGEYDLESEKEFAIIVEFVGEKWLSYSYNLSLVTSKNFRGSQIIYVDGVKYTESSHSKNTLSDTMALKALGDKYHRVEITFTAPYYYGTSTPKPTSIDFSISNITIKDDSQVAHASTTVNWDAYLGEVYYLPGVVDTKYTKAEFIIKNGIKLENQGGSATVSVPANMPIGLAVKPFGEVTSTIDPGQQASVHLGGIHYGENNVYGTSGGETILYFNEQGYVGSPGYYYNTPVNIILQEIAVLPKVSLTKTVGGDQETFEPTSGQNFLLDYATANNLVFAITQSPNKKEVAGQEFEITVNGKSLGAKEDTGEGASDKGYTFLDGKYGFNLANLTENTVVVITPNYGEEYVKTSYSISFNISSPHSGLPDVISPASAPITIEDDVANSWFFDPAYNGEDNMYAFSSPYTGKETPNYSVSQIGFKVKGTGLFQLEFYLDGPGKYSAAAYKTGSKIVPSSGDNFTSKDLGYNKGFQNGVATNLAIPQTSISWNGDITYAAPTICDSTHVKVLEGQDKWYTFTLGVNGGDEEETVIWFAHGIYNGTDSQYNRLTIRNVAYFSGTAYIDWGVEGADGTITKDSGKMTVDGGAAGIVNAGTAINFTAKPAAGQTFYGWKVISGTLTNPEKVGHEKEAGFTVEDSDITWDTENAKLVSYETSYRHVVGPGYNKVVAVMAENGTYAVRHGNKLYKPTEISSALSAAEADKNDKNVVVFDNVTLSGITVPAGVNLVIPFNRAGDFYAMGTAATAQTRVSWASGDAKYKDPVYTLTLTGENTINGTLTVGGVLHYPNQFAQGLTSGAYSQLVLSGEETKLNVGNGGHLDVYGRVTGEGSIDVTKGGKLSQPFMILDYNGGTNTEASFNAGVTPFKMYAMVNVQNKGGFTIHHGAELWGHASLYFWESITTIDTPFISFVNKHDGGLDYFENNALIVLNDDASAHIVYDDSHARPNMGANNNAQDVGKTTIEITGNAYADFMQFPLGINTQKVYFSIPYNFDITLKSGGTFDILYPYKAMPGAVLTVESGATLNVRGTAGLHVYDSFSIPNVGKRTYPTGEQLIAAGYKPYASLIVNGTLNIQEGATFLGTVQTTDTTGKAQIIVGNNVKLKDETLFDGVSTEYSCNYTKYTLEAHIWDKVHQKLAPLVAGKTYTSSYAGEADTFTLPGITFQIETTTGDHRNKEHTLTPSQTDAVSGLKGAWKVVHGEHEYDWTLTVDDKNFGGKKYKVVNHFCTAVGCDAPCVLLDVSDFSFSAIYKGGTFKQTEIEELLKTYFFGSNAFPEEISSYFSWTLSGLDGQLIKDAKGYNFTLALTRGCFYDGTGETGVTSKQLTFTVAPFDLNSITAEAVTTDSLNGPFTYNGEEQTVPQIAATIKGVMGSVTFGTENLEWANNVNASEGDASVTIKGTGNFTGSVTLNFSIAKATLTITLKKQTAVYSGKVPTVSSDAQWYTLNGLVNDEDGSDVKVTISIVPNGDKWDAGQYNLTATIESANYELKEEGGILDAQNAFVIEPKSIKDGTIGLSSESATYNGQKQELFNSFTLEGFESLAQGTDYEVSYSSDVTNVGTVTVKVEGKGNFTGEKTATYQITAYDITGKSSSAKVQTPEGGFVYKGEAWEPKIDFTLEGITGNITYTLGYKDNTNAGNATITVTGEDNFTGSFELNFTIEKATLTITPESKHSPKGQKQVALTATANRLFDVDKAAFEEAKDTIYTLSCDVNAQSEVGNYEIKVELKLQEWGNYKLVAGSGEGAYTVTAEVFANVKFPETLTVVYDGNAHTVEVTLGAPNGDRGQFGATTYTYHKDTVNGDTVNEMKNAGTYYVTAHITFTSDNGQQYETDISATFTITPKALTEGEVKIVLNEGDFTYTGEAITPTVKSVTCGALVLTASDFETAYDNNINAGSGAVVKVTGKGNFSGTVSTTFTIKPRSLENATVALAQSGTLVYNGRAQTPNVTVTVSVGERTLTLTGNDFTSKYSNNVHAGEATVTVEGTGNYTGSPAALTFTIAAKQIAVTINDQSLVYTGEAPALAQDRWTTLQNAIEEQNGVKDDLKITLTAVNTGAKWNVGTYDIQGVAGNQDYQVTFTNGRLTITKKAITVTVDDITAEYGAERVELTFSVDEDALGTGDTKDDLKVTLTLSGAGTGARLNVGSYMISGAAADSNYTVTFTGSWGGDHTYGTYTVTAKKITVTILSKEKVYDGTEPTLTYVLGTDWTVEEGAIESGDDLHLALRKEAGVNVKQGGYAITGTAANSNYEVEWVNGVFTITPRPVTVTIADQSDTYNYQHDYKLDLSKWTLDESTPLAEGETRDDLQITLTSATTDAGTYAIVGSSANGNYAVTFKGAYTKEGDPQSGKAGVYTVNKRDITDDENALFFMTATGSDDVTLEGHTLHITFTGLTLELSCGVTYKEGTANKTLKTTLSTSSLTATGEYEITVTLDDPNYSGTAVFSVIVTNADGYTEALQQKLSRLAALAEGKDKNALTADDFADIKEIAGILADLTETEKEIAAERLTQYSALVEAWNDLADIGDVAETAEAIAGSLIDALFAAAAALTALIGLAYITLKGGIL